MTLFVASLFLPYTVHFEVESSSTERNTAIGEVAVSVPVNKLNTKKTVRESFHNPDGTERRNSNKTISIIKALTTNKSTTNLSSLNKNNHSQQDLPHHHHHHQHGLHPDTGSAQTQGSTTSGSTLISNNNNQTSSNLASLSSNSANINNINDSNTNTNSVNNTNSSNSQFFRSDNLIDTDKSSISSNNSDIANTSTSSTVEQFFYGNPNAKNLSRSSSALDDITGNSDNDYTILSKQQVGHSLLSNSSPLPQQQQQQSQNQTISFAGLQVVNAPSSTFVQPRPLLRSANSFSISVSELKKGKNLLEPSLSSLKIHRGSSSLKVNRKTSTIVGVPSTIPQLPTTDSSLDESTTTAQHANTTAGMNPSQQRKRYDSFAIDDSIPTSIPQPHARLSIDDSVRSYDMKDLRISNMGNKDNKNKIGSDGMIHLVDADSSYSHGYSNYSHGYEFDKVTPFGGFSKPDYKQLLDTQNIFASAPWRIVEFDKGNGSLKKAIRLARLSNKFDDDNVKWIGTLAMPCDLVPNETKERISNELNTKYNSNPVYIHDDVFQGHYASFCKQILWPTFHYQIPDDPKSNAFENHSWNDYKEVNQLIANSIIAQYKDGDTVWVHDYHLLLVPNMIREKLPNAKIGFFLHVSFPSSEVFRCFAQRKNILQGILGADCIIFQTEEYVRHFFQTCNRLLLADFTEDGIKYNGRFTTVTDIPIGIDSSSLKKILACDKEKHWSDLVKERWNNKKIIVSRDKMDKIRGIKEKLLAYERFLDENPQYMDNVILILICLQNKNESSDDDYESSIWSIINRINSKTKNISTDKPVVLLNQDLEFEQYLALLSEADCFIVSTLREGMNLTSHEFVVASGEKHSPLILSEFTGSAQVLSKGGPLMINPYNAKQVACTIKQALEMSPEEKLERWNKMIKLINEHDSTNWVKNCLNSIDNAWIQEQKFQSFNLNSLNQKKFNEKYFMGNDNGIINKDSKRLIILNLGTLTSNVNIQGSSISPVQKQYIDKVLRDLTNDPQNIIYIISYLKRVDLTRKYKRIPELGLISENGGYIKLADSNRWISVVDVNELQWMPQIINLMTNLTERLNGSTIEIEECTIRFHTEQVFDMDPEHKRALVGDLITHINDLYSRENVHATLVNGIVIVQESNLAIRSLSFVISSHNNDKLFNGPIKLLPSSSSCSPLTQPNEEIIPTNSIDSTVEDSLSGRSNSTNSIAGGHNTISSFTNSNRIGLVMYAGGDSPVDEDIYSFCNEKFKNGEIDDVLTIKANNSVIKKNNDITNSSSLAGNKINGVNQLFTLLSSANSDISL
ncbi:transferase activity protein [[Candida] boidinii]|nr:transferase activity protein [[Candida] boidinii]